MYKKIFPYALFLIIFSVVSFVVYDGEMVIENEFDVGSYNIEKDDIEINESESINIKDKDSQVKQSKKSQGFAGIAELERWRATTGMSSDQDDLYSSYDIETLLKLAVQGDTTAMVLSSDYHFVKGDIKQAHAMAYQAAARGSNRALLLMASRAKNALLFLEKGYYTKEYVKERFAIPDDLDASLVLSRLALSHYAVAAIRGDVAHAKEFMELFQLRYRDGKPFSQDEWALVQGDANSIYRSLLDTRQQLGLTSFDNNYPEHYAYLHDLPETNNNPLGYLEQQLVK